MKCVLKHQVSTLFLWESKSENTQFFIVVYTHACYRRQAYVYSDPYSYIQWSRAELANLLVQVNEFLLYPEKKLLTQLPPATDINTACMVYSYMSSSDLQLCGYQCCVDPHQVGVRGGLVWELTQIFGPRCIGILTPNTFINYACDRFHACVCVCA